MDSVWGGGRLRDNVRQSSSIRTMSLLTIAKRTMSCPDSRRLSCILGRRRGEGRVCLFGSRMWSVDHLDGGRGGVCRYICSILIEAWVWSVCPFRASRGWIVVESQQGAWQKRGGTSA